MKHILELIISTCPLLLYLLGSIDISTSCELIQAPHRIYSNISNKLSTAHSYRIIAEWMKKKNFSSPAETLGNIEDTLFDLTYNSDSITQEMVPWITKVLENSLSGKKLPDFTPYQKNIQKLFKNEYQSYRNKWPQLVKSCFTPQRQAEHHSLRFADQRIKNYIKHRDIVDAGSYIGDSMLIFSQYTEKNIFCYEINTKSYKELVNNAALIGDKVKPIFSGLGSKDCQIGVKQAGGSTTTVKSEADNTVNITTLDKESLARGMKVGLIKADIEGMGYDLILGAKETIKRDRPVLTMLVYHNYDEFYSIPQLLREIGGYIFQYRGTHIYKPDLAEGQLFAIPQEVYFPKY